MKGKKLLSILLVLALALTYVPSDVLYVAAAGTEQQAVAAGTDANEIPSLPKTEGVEPQDEDSVLEQEITDFQKNITDEAIALGIPDAFIRHYFANDLKEKNIADPVTELTEGEKDPGIEIEAVTSTQGIEGIQIMKVDTGVLARTKFDLGEFDFSDMKAGNMVYNMLAKKNLKGKAYFYFAEQEEPFATATIKRTQEEWGATKNLVVDVRNAGLSGKGHIYVTFIADSAYDAEGVLVPVSGVKGNLYFESLFFTEGSTPVIDFDLDNEINSIEQINGSPEHTITGYGNMNVKIPDGYQCEYTDKTLKDETYELDYIRGRGNSTWLVDKKPYKIKLEKKADLFGMGKSKHWVLLANYYDYSLIRNKLTTYLAEQIGLEFTPKSVCVDLIISGEYYGSYQLSQHVRIEDTSVNVDDLEDHPATEEPDITGGYLLSMGESWLSEDVDSIEFIDKQHRFRIEKPEYDENYPAEAKAAQMEYLRQYIGELDALVDALAPTEEENGINPEIVSAMKGISIPEEDENSIDQNIISAPEGKTWRDYLDENSLIDYYLIQEFSQNGDAFGSSSTYLYKKRNGKLYFGPVWDFDFVAWAAYQTNYVSEVGVDNFTKTTICPWFAKLIQYDPEFKQHVQERWTELQKVITAAVSKGGFIDQYSGDIYYSALANYQVRGSYLMQEDGYWGGQIELIDDDGNPYVLNYTNEIDRLKKFITARMAWVDKNIENIDSYESDDEGYTDDIPDVPFYVDGELVGTVPFDFENDKLKADAFPEAPDKEGYVFAGWYYTQEDETYKIINNAFPYTCIYDEQDNWSWVPYEVHAKYIPESEYKEVEEFHFITDTIYLPLYRYSFDSAYDYYFGGDDGYYVCDVDLNLSRFLSYKPFDATDADDFIWSIVDNGEVDAYIYIDQIEISEPGEVTVSCKYKDQEATVKVVAFDADDAVEPDSFTYENALTLKVGEYGTIHFAFDAEENVPCNRYADIEFQSLDEDVVEVNAVGEVYAKSAGSARVTILDRGRKERIKVVNITVTEDETQIPDEGTSEDEKTSEEGQVTSEEPTTEAKPEEKPATGDKPEEKPTTEAKPEEKPTTEAKPAEKPTTEAKPAEKPTTEAKPTEKPTTVVKTVEKPTTVAKTTKTQSQTSAGVKKPGKTTIKKINKKKKSSKQIKLTLKSVSGAKGYQVAVYTSKKNANKNKKAIVKVFAKKNKVTVSSKKLKNKKTLYVKVRAYKLNGKNKVYGAWSNAKKVKLK